MASKTKSAVVHCVAFMKYQLICQIIDITLVQNYFRFV